MDPLLPEIKYPIGIQTFSEIIEEGYLYVDKTRLVYKLANSYKYAFLSRPRRFGKSLLLSTLQSYFEGNKALFRGLELERFETDWRRYPVLRFDFSAASYSRPEVLANKIDAYLTRFQQDYGVAGGGELGDRFYNLINGVYEKSGQRVVVLIDEYDKPILDSLHDDTLQEALKAELRGFYSVLKECDEMIRFAMLTGVTKFGKVSIFSGLNNLKDISLNPDYNAICGITEDEFKKYFIRPIDIFAEVNSISVSEAWKRFKTYYDGYHFSYPAADIYNPFSTINAFDDNRIKGYWFSSGSPTYLIKLIERHQFVLQNLDNAVRGEEELSDITDTSHDIVPLLYQAGYLTIKTYDEVLNAYTLRFPNKEVYDGFWNSLANYFFRKQDSLNAFSLQAFIKDLMCGAVEEFMRRMQSLFSSLDSASEKNKEVHFQNMITIFVNMLGFKAVTEVHSAQGRSDIVIETPRYIYILELKLGGTPREALAQIHAKGYASPYAIDPRKKILIGANFSRETRTLTGWEIDESYE